MDMRKLILPLLCLFTIGISAQKKKSVKPKPAKSTESAVQKKLDEAERKIKELERKENSMKKFYFVGQNVYKWGRYYEEDFLGGTCQPKIHGVVSEVGEDYYTVTIKYLSECDEDYFADIDYSTWTNGNEEYHQRRVYRDKTYTFYGRTEWSKEKEGKPENLSNLGNE